MWTYLKIGFLEMTIWVGLNLIWMMSLWSEETGTQIHTWRPPRKHKHREHTNKFWRFQPPEPEDNTFLRFQSVPFSSVAQSCPTLCNPVKCSTPGLPIHHQLPEFTQTHVHWVSDAIQPSHLLSSPSHPVPNPSQHQSLFQWVNSSHEEAKVLEFQLQHQSFQWTPRTDLL